MISMTSNLTERALIFLLSPPWPKIGVGLIAFGGVVGAIGYNYTTPSQAGLLSTIATGGSSALLIFLSMMTHQRVSGIEITCIQTRPNNSVENHHKNRFKMNDGVGHLDIYIKLPDWTSEFKIKMDTDPEIDIIPFNRLPSSVKYEGNVLKSDYKLPEFPLILKLSGDPDELGEGEYYFKFTDKRTGVQIKEITLKCDPDPPTSRSDRDEEKIDEWF